MQQAGSRRGSASEALPARNYPMGSLTAWHSTVTWDGLASGHALRLGFSDRDPYVVMAADVGHL